MTTWHRTAWTSDDYGFGANWCHAIANGDTYQRVHFSFGFYGDTPVESDLELYAGNLLAVGVCTTIGNGSETPPNPWTSPQDQAPPEKRWLYWTCLSPVVTAIDRDAGLITWANSPFSEPTQSRGQVAATGLPGGDTLNLWVVWAANADWENALGGNVKVWGSASVLAKI
ncbi:MAG: hypothetical protein KGJ86_11350 [Chloroflexota bacterium]|nr:hypothetical protein [Chloroflexota bacterium]